jgi:GT2 family glycosyltransferase
MLIKSEVLEKVGLFDDKYFLYYEDADLDIRIKNAGYDIYYVPKAVLKHVNASSSGGAGNRLQDYLLTRMLFGMRYAPFKSKIALIKQSIKLLLGGRSEQKRAIRDFYLGRWGKGSFFTSK